VSSADQKKSRRPLIRSILGSIVIGFIIFLVVGAYAPDSSAFSPNNYGWNGLHTIYTTYSFKPVNSLSDIKLPPTTFQNRTVLLIIQPATNFSSSDVLALKSFFRAGGTVMVADNYGYSNFLLEQLKAGVQISKNLVVVDPLYNWKSPVLSVGAVPHSLSVSNRILSHVAGIAMDEASPLKITGYPGLVTFAFSSQVSFATTRSKVQSNPLSALSTINIGKLPRNETGSLPLMTTQRIANGTLIVSGDPDLFMNELLGEGDNARFASNLLNDSTVYLDTSNWAADTSVGFKSELSGLYSELSQPPINYLATVGIVEAAVLIAPLYSDAREAGRRRGKLTWQDESNADEADREEFDQEMLDRVRKDREKYGVR
jgi:hypothetical protein